MVPWFRYIIVFNTMGKPRFDSGGPHVYTVKKTSFSSHTKHTAKTTNTDLFHSWEITCNLEF